MKNRKKLIDTVGNSGTEFVCINGYVSKGTGEIANHTINVGITVMNAKKKDFKTLQNCTNADLHKMNRVENFGIETYRKAYFEMLASAEKNLNPDVLKRSNQSQGTTNAFIQLTPAIKYCKESGEVHIFGQAIAKVVVPQYDDEGNEIVIEYETINSADKTLAKKMITKTLNLRAGKYRTFIIANIDSVKTKGEVIEIN